MTQPHRRLLLPAGTLALLIACGSAEGERASAAAEVQPERARPVPAAAPARDVTPVAAGEPATCVLDDAAPAPCTVSFGTSEAGERTITAALRAGRSVTFSGSSAGPWYSGTLDGAPAMGVEMNRGHLRFSTTALDRTFSYWTRGNEHGTY